MNVRTIEEMLEDEQSRRICVIDVRERADYEKDTYPGAMHIFWQDWAEHRQEVPRDLPVYLMCYSGKNSADLAQELQEDGIEAYNVEGGYYSWLRYLAEQFMQDEQAADRRCKEIERSLIKKFRKEIWSQFTKAINQYHLIEDGDKIAVCISGGKDSMLMAKLFQELHAHGKANFEVVYLVMNPGYNDVNYKTILNNAKLLQVPIHVFESDIYNIVAGDEIAQGSPCYICARMRRGALYAHAKELGCNKIALGHHYDDVIETILMGMLYSGQIQTMMPKLFSTNFPGMELIRPLYLIREDDIKRWRDYNGLNFIQCACRFTESCASCGGTEKGSKRAQVKELIRQLHEENPYTESNIFKSVENVHLNAIIGYKDKNGNRHTFLDREEYHDKEN